MSLDQPQDAPLVLPDQVSVHVVGSVLDLFGALGLRNQLLELLLWHPNQFLVEVDLLGDGAQAEILRYADLKLLAHGGHEEHKCVLQGLGLGREGPALALNSERLGDRLVETCKDLFVVHAGLIQADYAVPIHLDEGLLRPDVLVRHPLDEQFLHRVQETVRVKVQEKAHELIVGEEPDDVVDVAAPLKRRKLAYGELLALNEQAGDPKQLVPDVGPTVLNIQLDLSVTEVLLISRRSIVLCFEHRGALALDIVRQLHHVVSHLDLLIPHHHVEERAEDADADRRVIAFIVIKQSGEQVYERRRQVSFLADVPHLHSMRVLGQV